MPQINSNHPQQPVKECPSSDGCITTGYKYADISVPVELVPGADLGKIETECCGEPYLECKKDASGKTCEIILTQKISVKIPVKYDVRACIGEAKINCNCDCNKG